MSHPEKYSREILPGGAVRIAAGGCTFIYTRPRPGALRVDITGHDKGQFGTGTLDEIATALQRERPLELFVDARNAVGAAVSVSDEWTRFFATNRADLHRVHVLAGSKIVQLTVAIAQHLSRTGNLIQIYSDPEIFESGLRGGKPAP
jgi:hypothetical protein